MLQQYIQRRPIAQTRHRAPACAQIAAPVSLSAGLTVYTNETPLNLRSAASASARADHARYAGRSRHATRARLDFIYDGERIPTVRCLCPRPGLQHSRSVAHHSSLDTTARHTKRARPCTIPSCRWQWPPKRSPPLVSRRPPWRRTHMQRRAHAGRPAGSLAAAPLHQSGPRTPSSRRV